MHALAGLFLLFSYLGFGMAPVPPGDNGWFTAGRSTLCVTEGAVNEVPGGRLSIEVPKMRAYVNRWSGQAVEARFTYLGPTSGTAALGSGAVRRQFGLKLEAQDGCNLVYAMWRFEPQSELVVSVKQNAGQHSSSECVNKGYRNIMPEKSSALPAVKSGDAHTLRAEIKGAQMNVYVDNVSVWEGSLGVLPFQGPVGMRSDNARLQLELLARSPGVVRPHFVMACKTGEDESD